MDAEELLREVFPDGFDLGAEYHRSRLHPDQARLVRISPDAAEEIETFMRSGGWVTVEEWKRSSNWGVSRIIPVPPMPFMPIRMREVADTFLVGIRVQVDMRQDYLVSIPAVGASFDCPGRILVPGGKARRWSENRLRIMPYYRV